MTAIREIRKIAVVGAGIAGLFNPCSLLTPRLPRQLRRHEPSALPRHMHSVIVLSAKRQ